MKYRIKAKLSFSLKKLCIISLASITATSSLLTPLPASAQVADCNDSTRPSATASITVDATATYRIWGKVIGSNEVNAFGVKVDDNACITMGNTPLPSSVETWIGHQNGNTQAAATVALTAGTHQLRLVGIEPGLKISQLLLTSNLSCVPEANGENCSVPPTTDTEAPSTPSSVKATATSSTAIAVSWAASQDNIGVVAYDVYRSSNNTAATKITSTSSLTHNDTQLTANTAYTYYIVARDSAGNQSAASVKVTASTQTLPQLPQGKGKLYGQVKVGTTGKQATISFSVNGVVTQYKSDTRGYYYIADIPAGTYMIRYQSNAAFKDIEVKIRAYADTVKDVSLPRSTPISSTLSSLLAASTLYIIRVDLQSATLSQGATFVQNVLQLGEPAVVTPPTQTNNCIQNPSACGYPDATNTGYKPTGIQPTTQGITIREGDYNITQAGAVIDGKHIKGCVNIKAPNVTIKRSLISDCRSYFNVRIFEGAGNFTLEDTEIDGKNFDGQNAALVDDGRGPVTIRRMYMHNVSDGPHPGENWLMEDSYITDLYACSICHNDSIQSAGAYNVTLRHNTIVNTPDDHPSGEGGKNAVVRIATEQGPVDGFIIENNLLSGGNFAVQVRSQGNGEPKNVKILHNRIVPNWRFGPYDLVGQVQLSGNIRDDNGQSLNTP